MRRIGVIEDLRYGARLLRRSPVFASVAIVVLALGIGANSAVFSIVNAVLLRPLPFDRSDELFVVASTYEGVRREFSSFSNFVDWRAQSRTFSHMAAVRGDGVRITTPDGPEYLTGAAVSEDFFALLGVQPFLGRTFLADEHRLQQARVVILSYGLWLRRFGGVADIVGTSVILDGERNTIAGVMPAGFAFPPDAEIWRPLSMVPSDAGRGSALVRVIGRLRTEASAAQAQAEMTVIARQLEERYPNTNAAWGVEIVSLLEQATQNVRPSLLAAWGAVACVLLIACANVGILLLARSIRRVPELALRAALGAGQARIVRQLLAEGVLLAALGGAGGVVVAAWGLFVLRALAPADTPRLDEIGLDRSVLIFTAAISLVTGLVVGIAPARRVVRWDLCHAFKEGAPSVSGSTRHRRIMRGLVMSQLAAAVVLLVGAGLLMRTLERLQAVHLGFNSERLLTFYVSLPERHYPGDAEVSAFFGDLLARIRALPGVHSASAVNALYIHWSDAFVLPVRIEGREVSDSSRPADTHIRIVETELHGVLQVPVLRGRSFTAEDGPDAPPVAVINESMARRYFPGEDPIGRRVSVRSAGPGQPLWQEIVGVVGDIRQRGLDADASPEVQIPYAQSPIGQLAIVVRAEAEPTPLMPVIRAQLRALDPNLPLTFIQTMDDVLGKSLATRRFSMRVLAIFATVALMLAAIGLYGVMAATVGERAREIAVRLALGATSPSAVRTVLGPTVVVAVAGVALGLVTALAATRYLEPLLFGVARTDPATYIAVAALLVLVGVVSGYLPARRVARVDPMVTLRSQ